MKRLPSREEVLAMLDRLEQEPADALESDVLEFKRWQDPRTNMSEAIEARLRHKIASAGPPLERYYGSPFDGIKTGLDEAFLIDQHTRDLLVSENPRCSEILKPVLEDKDIKPWLSEWRALWLMYTYHGIDMSPYPAVLDYLRTFRYKLEQRATARLHGWYELQQPQLAYVPAFEGPKIVWPGLQNTPRYAFDSKGYYINAPACCLPTEDWVLLAILNSKVGWYWMQSTAIMRQSRWLETKPQYVGKVPIAQVPDAEQRVITELAQQLSQADCLDRLALEAELNDRVAALYGLTPDERRIVDGLPLPGSSLIEREEEE